MSNGAKTAILSTGMPRIFCKVARTEFLSVFIKVLSVIINVF